MNVSDITGKIKDLFGNVKDFFVKTFKSKKDLSDNVIVIEKNGIVKVYSKKEGAEYTDTVKLGVEPFADDFFDAYVKQMTKMVERYPSLLDGAVDIVIPDDFIITDSINIPIAKKKAMENAFSVAVDNLYKSADKMKANSFPLSQNKQNGTFALVGIRSEYINKLLSATSMAQMNVGNITYSANAVVNAGLHYNSKLRSASFVLLDIHEDDACVIFVTKGRTRGFYPLPFGYSCLKRHRIVPEDKLFDHSAGELLVLNAKEKARHKQLTMAEASESQEQVLVTDVDPVTGEEVSYYAPVEIEVTGKKGRKLPKFMQRPTPDSEEGYVYENFRYFLKWCIILLRNNPEVTHHGAIEAVYVNMPKQFDFLYERVNSHTDSHGLEFFPLLPQDVSEDGLELKIHGALLSETYNKVNNF